ncbi:hypothetical protein ACLRDC_10780 [Gluconacetobacter sacchari]|uniref:hypothetical protein n=1 Tax=Gluconacetobacter sacchari TaxID=92759 RepID=UPI0039B3B07D
MTARRAPERLVRAAIDPAPLMLGNDRLGNCTAAGLGNHIRATAALAGYQVAVRKAEPLCAGVDGCRADGGTGVAGAGASEADATGGWRRARPGAAGGGRGSGVGAEA